RAPEPGRYGLRRDLRQDATVPPASPAARARRTRVVSRSGRADGEAAPLQDPPALTLGRTAPHAMVDAVVERVLEARVERGARGADLAGTVDTDAVAGEEGGGWVRAAVAVGHPTGVGVIHHHGVSLSSYRPVTSASAGGLPVPGRPTGKQTLGYEVPVPKSRHTLPSESRS